MIYALLALVGISVLLLILVLRKLPPRRNDSEPSVGTLLTSTDAAFGNLTSRLESLQHGFSTSLATSLQAGTQGIISAIAGVKEETRSQIDERIQALASELRAGFDSFREKIDRQIGSARTETQHSLSDFSTALDKRSGLLQTQVSSALSELRNSVKDELTSGRTEARDSLNLANTNLLGAFQKLQQSNENKLTEIRQSLEAKLTENIEKNIGAFKDMTAGIAELRSTSEKIMQVSEEIGELTDILSSPKLRGDFGEFELENALKDLIPADHYEIKANVNGALADAAILLKEGKLCIDSKFPLDNYRKASDTALSDEERRIAESKFLGDVRNHIDTIAAKYIVPGITLDIAFMYVPAESVYYQILLDSTIQEHCRNCKVLAVSPNTLYAYLQVLAIGFRGMKLQDAAKKIETVLLKLKYEFDHFKENFRVLGSHLQHAQDRFSEANLDAQQFSVTLDCSAPL
ncbi:MAG: DNA recombination protein RmuC [Candidatus Acidiferrales bacterium]